MTKMKSSSTLENKLKRTLFKQRLVLFASGLLITTGVVLAAAVVLSLLATLMILPVWTKICLLSVTGLATVYLLVRFGLLELFKGNVDSIAVRLEEKHPELEGRLVAAVQFARMKQPPGYSHDLMQLTQKQALELAKNVRFGQAVSLYRFWRTARLFAVAGVLATLLLVIFPGMFSYSYKVYSNPTTEVAPPIGYRLTAFPGSMEWVKYRDIEFGAALIGFDYPETATIHYRFADGSWQQTKVDLLTLRSTLSEAGDSLTVATTLRQVNKSFDYWIEAGRVKTGIQKIDVVDRPRVNGIKLSIFYPDYTGLSPTVIDENNGSFSAVVGSRINMEIAANLPIEKADLVFEDSSRTPLKVENRSAKTSLQVSRSQAYHIWLMDHLNEVNPDPIDYFITAIPDEYPSIDVLRPGFDVNLTDEMSLPLKVRIFDDFGFSSLALKYVVFSQGRQSDENVAVLHYKDRIKTEGDVEFSWDLGQFNLYPGDFVAYYFEVADNDRVSGPKVTTSRRYVARIPSLEEIVSQTEGESMQRVRKTEDLIKSGHELSERLKNVARKLQAEEKQSPTADWQQKKELSNIAEENAELVKNIEKTAEQMNKAVDKMAQNSLMSRQVLEKLAEIQKLFAEVATPEMKEAQKKLMEALKNMNRDDINEALKDFELSMEELMQRLERTLSLLKKMQMEQKMEAMIRKAEQLAKQQEDVNKTTDSSAKNDLPNLSKKEDQIESSLKDLKKEVGDLEQMAKEAKMEQSPEPQKFMEAVKKTDADENMRNMSDNLQSGQKQDAASEGKKAYSKLMEMLDRMQQEYASMRDKGDSKLEQAMRVATEDANYLSQEQESLQKEAAGMQQEPTILRDLATTQQDLLSACNGLKKRIREMGEESPFVAAELERMVNEATQCMGSAVSGFDEKQSIQAQRQQREAMAKMNRVAIRLMESLQQQKQCNNGGNCDKNIKQLQSLCDKQKSLNQQTQQQCDNPGQANPKLGAGGRQELERLAGEQAAVRKSLEDLAREFGQSRQVLGRLDDIAREMQAIEEDLGSGEVGQDTREKQLKVYSRMLEATRSLQRRDFTEQRQATSASSEDYYAPPSLSEDLLLDRLQLEDRLKRYLSEGYPAQYEEQIKAYFKALLQAKSEMQRQVQPTETNRP